MKAILTASNPVSDFVTSLWTPVFVGLFVSALLYALWPRNRATFDKAANIPLED